MRRSRRESQRLLLIACTARKKRALEALRALDLYDGPSFRVLRKYLREEHANRVATQVAILSGKHGLISLTRQVRPYDVRLTGQRAARLRSQVARSLRRRTGQPRSAFIFMGPAYFDVLPPLNSIFPRTTRVVVASGGIGHRLGQLRRWLYSGA